MTTDSGPERTTVQKTPPRRLPLWRSLLALLIVLMVGVWALNYVQLQRPLEQQLDSDSRNAGYSLAAHYRYYLDFKALVLDLKEVSSAAPVDLFRGLFTSAEVLGSHAAISRVILARDGEPIYQMTGDDFRDLGQAFERGENPVYLIRTLPEKLYLPDGEPAFARWTGGLLGVASKQMEEVVAAGQTWSGARDE